MPELGADFDALSTAQRKFLARRICDRCGVSMGKGVCLANADPCSEDNLAQKRVNIMRAYKPETEHVRATLPQQMAMGEMVERHTYQRHNGWWAYEPGWDDRRIAHEVSKDLRPNHAQTVRLALDRRFGSGRGSGSKRNAGKKMDEMKHRIEQIEQRLADIEAAMTIPDDGGRSNSPAKWLPSRPKEPTDAS